MATRKKVPKKKGSGTPRKSRGKLRRKLAGDKSWPVIVVSLDIDAKIPVICTPSTFQVKKDFDTIIWVRADNAGFTFRAFDFVRVPPAGMFGLTSVQSEVITLDADGEDCQEYEYRITVEKDGVYYSTTHLGTATGSPVIRNK
jgi:hypothetical protein